MVKTNTRTKRLWRRFLSPFSTVNKKPIIILGKEKTGSTAIAALLAKSTNKTVTLDLPQIWGATETKIYAGEISFEKFVKKNKYEFSRDIIKEPGLTVLYPIVQQTFPEAKFAMIVRDPRDNIRSILARLKIPGNIENISVNHPIYSSLTWQIVLDNSWLGIKGGTFIEQLAHRWNYVTDIFINNKKNFVLVKYENFEQNKVETIKELARQLTLQPVKNISQEVDIQYQPRANRNLSWEETFGKDNLFKIEKICQSRMIKLGYETTLR